MLLADIIRSDSFFSQEGINSHWRLIISLISIPYPFDHPIMKGKEGRVLKR